MTNFEKSKLNYKLITKFQNSIRSKSKRRFDKLFSAEELNGLTAKSDYNSVYFEKLNEYNNWRCLFWINPVYNSDGVLADLIFTSQDSDYLELPKFLSDKKQQILDIFTELQILYTSDESELKNVLIK